MNFGRIIKSISLRQLVSLTSIAIKSPRLFYCFIKATKECISKCDQKFGKTHHKNNKANAYRHALWNMLIALRSVQAGKKLSVSLDWAKTITDWHELSFVNKPLEKQMDLHNNAMGRLWFREMYTHNPSLQFREIDQKLTTQLELAELISEEQYDSDKMATKMVYTDSSFLSIKDL